MTLKDRLITLPLAHACARGKFTKREIIHWECMLIKWNSPLYTKMVSICRVHGCLHETKTVSPSNSQSIPKLEQIMQKKMEPLR